MSSFNQTGVTGVRHLTDAYQLCKMLWLFGAARSWLRTANRLRSLSSR